VKIDVPLPNRDSLTMAIASSSDSASTTVRTGPKTSSCTIGAPGSTPSRIVGPTYDPSGWASAPRPSTASVAPSSTARSIQPVMRSRAAHETTGPTSTDSSRPSPTESASVASTSAGMSRSWASPTVTTTEPAMQRWPAAPKAEPMIPLTVWSMTASGMTTMWFFAPPSAWTRLPVFAAPS
jgi:hypothetical protein